MTRAIERGAKRWTPAEVVVCACLLCDGADRFDYDTTTDFGADEDSVLAEVLRRSREEV